MHFVNKVLEHFFGHDEVGDHTIFHGTDSGNIARGAAQHAFGFGPDGSDHFLGVIGTDGHDRGFVKYNAAFAHVDKGVGGAQVDGQVA